MRIKTLIEQRLQLSEHMHNSQTILTESCVSLDRDQKRVVEGIYQALLPLIEASLTADQVQQVFAQVEKNATAAGGNRTGIGKGIDTAKKANEIINNVGKWLQDTTPVKAFDAKFEKLKNVINTKFPDSKILDGVSNLGIWVKENPGKTAAVIGVLTAIAALAGGPVGGAIAGQVLKGSVELLKGEKLSTAVGKGLKAAAVGWLAGKSFEVIGDAVGKGVATVADKMYPGATKLNLNYIATGTGYPSAYENIGVVATQEDAAAIKSAFNAGAKAWRDQDFQASQKAFAKAAELAAKASTPEYFDALKIVDAGRDQLMKQGQDAVKLIQGIGAAAQGAATGATGMDKTGQPTKESYYRQTRPLSEGQVYLLFNKIQRLDEGPFDAIKAGASKLAGAAATKIGQVGTNLTTKVTADKLNSAWKAAGSPVDSNELAAFLEKQGVDSSLVTQVYADMKLSGTEQTVTSYDDVKKLISALAKKDRQRMMQYVKKQLGVA